MVIAMSLRVVLRTLLASAAFSAALSGVLAACSASTGDGSSCTKATLPAACPTPPPSFSADVQPIIEQYCYGCHAQGGVEVSQYDFSKMAIVRDNRDVIATELSVCSTTSSGMPPPDAGQPSVAQRETVIAWATVCGAPDN
jgi:uncharacterized membrane protein